MPRELREGFRFQKFGAPYRGGYRDWPARWFLPVEAALNVYEILTIVDDAISTMKEKELQEWKAKNNRLVQEALNIRRERDKLEAADNG